MILALCREIRHNDTGVDRAGSSWSRTTVREQYSAFSLGNSSVPGRPDTDCVPDAIPCRGMRPFDLA